LKGGIITGRLKTFPRFPDGLVRTMSDRNHRINHEPVFLLNAVPWRESSLRLEVFSRRYGRLALPQRFCDSGIDSGVAAEAIRQAIDACRPRIKRSRVTDFFYIQRPTHQTNNVM